MTDRQPPALLIGGPSHGETVMIDEGRVGMPILVPVFRASTFQDVEEAAPLSDPVGKVLYEMMKISMFGFRCAVWHVQGMDEREVGRRYLELVLNDQGRALLAAFA